MVATRQARAAARDSVMRAARLFESLDLGVLSVVASFGTTAEFARLGVALGKDRGAELTVKALHNWQLALDVSRWDRAVAEDIAAKRDMSEDDYYFLRGRVKESVCFPFEYDGPAFAGRCECCCPPSLTSPVFRKIDVTPKPDDVHPSSWYRDY